jgi:homoserine dehydrogenase
MRRITVALAGLGTVGSGVIHLLQDQADLIARRADVAFDIIAVAARDPKKQRSFNIPQALWFADARDLVDTQADIIVELIGGADGIAFDLARKTLLSGKPLVTANKAMLAKHGSDLAMWSRKGNVQIFCEASVAGGLPVIKVLREGLSANSVTHVRGILNGTCNYILTTMMREQRQFDDVLAEAQAKGYAEADPSFDIDGWDTAHKLSLLTAFAFDTVPQLSGIGVKGIRHLTLSDLNDAKQKGGVIKLIAQSAKDPHGNITQIVEPLFLDSASPLAQIDGVLNAVEINTSHAGPIFIQGRGAGAQATASAVVADLIDFAMGRGVPFLKGRP